MLYVLSALILLIIVGFFVLGMMSKNGQALGLSKGKLQACTSIQNCVISERIDGASNTVDPFVFQGDEVLFMDKLQSVVKSMGGEVVTVDKGYIAATFSSSIFGFVDDLELRVSSDKQLHFRSSSRVGRSDFGANKKRVEALKLQLQQ